MNDHAAPNVGIASATPGFKDNATGITHQERGDTDTKKSEPEVPDVKPDEVSGGRRSARLGCIARDGGEHKGWRREMANAVGKHRNRCNWGLAIVEGCVDELADWTMRRVVPAMPVTIAMQYVQHRQNLRSDDKHRCQHYGQNPSHVLWHARKHLYSERNNFSYSRRHTQARMPEKVHSSRQWSERRTD